MSPRVMNMISITFVTITYLPFWTEKVFQGVTRILLTTSMATPLALVLKRMKQRIDPRVVYSNLISPF